jgi:uncharacterized membrane protein HdeD (DUF308 family)
MTEQTTPSEQMIPGDASPFPCWLVLLRGILALIFGHLLFINPFIAVVMLPFVAGGFSIGAGIASMVMSFPVKKAQAALAQ